ncbi:MAG: hypothetical protein U0840_02045 [Gemmataceae bacterium]
MRSGSTGHWRPWNPLVERLTFLRPPYDLANGRAAADAVEADLLVLDYPCRIKPGGEHGDSCARSMPRWMHSEDSRTLASGSLP